ncbi:MAG: ABC transporter ATP-binding protein [Thermoplasmata archaeon]
MVDEKDILVEIEDLFINFYTYQGIVKAIDGVNLKILKGETLGLVGETGCGKSVTARAIMKLIQVPPGKIESGSVFFMEPPNVRALRKQFEAEAQKWYSALPPDSKKKYAEKYAMTFKGFDRRSRRQARRESVVAGVPEKIPHALKTYYLLQKSKSPQHAKDETYQAATKRSYDMITRSPKVMEKIRGKFISMIFQEPTSALNPVFMVGDQIAEVIMLHKLPDLAKKVTEELKKSRQGGGRSARPKKAKDKSLSTGLKCSDCSHEVRKEDRWCGNCGARFLSVPGWHFRRILTSYYLWAFQKMIKKPNAFGLRLLSRIPLLRGFKKELYAQAFKQASDMLGIVRIPDPESIVYRYPHELSGGMQQRVMIAMALACNPNLLIADEPTTALDVTIQAQILKLMRDLKKEFGSSILLITHNLGVVAEMCDRVGVMYAGSMAEIADARTIFKFPKHPYTIGLMKAVPTVAMELERLSSIPGNVPNLIKPPSGCRFHPRCEFAKEFCKLKKPELVEIEKGHFVACHKVSGAREYV